MIAFLLLAVLAGQAGWTKFASTDTSASFEAPCTLRGDKTSVPRAGIQPAHTDWIYSCTAADEQYLFGFTEYEASFKPDPEGERRMNRDNLVKGINATVLTSNTITTAGNLTALEFTANWAERNRLVTSRVFFLNNRPYILAIVTPIAADHSANIRRFLQSFTPPR